MTSDRACLCSNHSDVFFFLYLQNIQTLDVFFSHSNAAQQRLETPVTWAAKFSRFLRWFFVLFVCVCVWACRFFVVSYILLLCPFLSFLFSPSWKASEASTELQRSVNGFSPCLTEFFFSFPPIFNCDYHVFFLPSFAVHYRAKAELSAVLLSIPRL